MPVAAEDDPLQLRPDPDNLVSKVGAAFTPGSFRSRQNPSEPVRLLLHQLSESEESDAPEKTEKEAAPSGGRKYIPPKIAPVHYGKIPLRPVPLRSWRRESQRPAAWFLQMEI